MRWFLIFICQVYFHISAPGQTLGLLPRDTNSISYKTSNGDSVVLSVRHLFYKSDDGTNVPTRDSYILEVINGHYPRIIDCIQGIEPSFQISKLGGTNDPKLLIFYYAGANQYCLKIYRLDGTEIIPFKTQPGCSDTASILLKGGEIIVQYEEINIDGTSTLYTDTYRVVDDECKLLSGEKKILKGDQKN
jgi:hypothetical protein